jgi:HemK-related putative methylase
MTFGKRFVLRANSLIRKYVFCRRGFVRVLFGIDVVALPTVQTYCEWATIMLRFVMKRYIRPGISILELGTGAHAILAIFAKKHFSDVSVVATDIVPERVLFARKTAARNKVNVTCVVADVFEGVAGKFDLILFNPPYIPSGELKELGYELKTYHGIGSRRDWTEDGGPDGLDVIRAFLDGLGEHLAAKGRAVIVINPIHIGVSKVRELCKKAGLTIECIHTLPGIDKAYVLTAEQSQNKKGVQKTRHLFDLVVSAICLILGAVPMVAIGLAVRLLDGAPVFFCQTRVGRGMRPFRLYKFRTMKTSSECNHSLTVGDDSRITKLGFWLRKYHLDELPQLFNIFVGEMSFIGPRPEIPEFVDKNDPL